MTQKMQAGLADSQPSVQISTPCPGTHAVSRAPVARSSERSGKFSATHQWRHRGGVPDSRPIAAARVASTVTWIGAGPQGCSNRPMARFGVEVAGDGNRGTFPNALNRTPPLPPSDPHGFLMKNVPQEATEEWVVPDFLRGPLDPRATRVRWFSDG